MLDMTLADERVVSVPFVGLRSLTVADEEAAARKILLPLIAGDRVAFSRWVYAWLGRLDKGVTTSMHDALLRAGLASEWPSYTRRLLARVEEMMLGIIDEERLVVILQELKVMSACYALWDMKPMALPGGVKAPTGPYPEEARQLADRLNADGDLHEDFYYFVRDELFGSGGLAVCASMLGGRGLLAGSVVKNQIRNLKRQLRGERDIRGRRHLLTLPVLAGVCTYTTISPVRMTARLGAWQAKRQAKAA